MKTRKTLPIIISAILIALLYYIVLPPINIHSVSMWMFLIFAIAIFITIYGLCNVKQLKNKKSDKVINYGFGIASVIIVFLIIGGIFSSKIFRAKSFSEIIYVQEGTVEQLPLASGKDSIALMDTASAEKLGNREIGSLSDVVSQYDVSEYTQIDYQGSPMKVSPLRYADFFKWTQNSANGTPGYVTVDPVSMKASYTALNEGMKYVPSAYFSQDLYRHIRFAYPTEIFGNVHFEIDEDGNPYYIASTYEYQIGLFGGKQVNGIILVNPITGEMKKMNVDEVDQWVDVVYPGDLICEQYNNYAQLQKGFFNSIFGQVGSRKITEYTPDDDDEDSYSDYGYISKDGDIWIYTGVTSVNSDSSNIGFIMVNERTEETYFIPCAGADEFSAMASAEGEVQEKGYQASFPSLILIDDVPTYIMVLKDDGGLVKMYACVNVEQYNMVATATTQDACIQKYQALVHGEISQEDATNDNDTVIEHGEYEEKTIIIQKLQTIDQNGNTYIYIVDTENNIYYARFSEVLDMLLVEEGDTITIQTDETTFHYERIES